MSRSSVSRRRRETQDITGRQLEINNIILGWMELRKFFDITNNNNEFVDESFLDFLIKPSVGET